MTDDALTPLQGDEKEAMTLDRAAILRVVSGLRGYRAEVKALLAKRYSDGEVDGATLSLFALRVDEIEGTE